MKVLGQMAKATFSVKNFSEHQHYKDRNPIWIKLYNKLLDDYEFGLLPDASKGHLVAIWLLASRYNNIIPLDPKWVASRINATDAVDLNILRDSGFIEFNQEGIITLAARYQDAIPEKRISERRDREDTSSLRSDVPAKQTRKSKRSLPEDFPLQDNFDWAKTHWLQKGRFDLCDSLSEEISKFRDFHTAKGSTSADWSASWRTWAQNAIKFNNGGHNGRSQPRKTAHQKFIEGAYLAIHEPEAGMAGNGGGDFDETGIALLAPGFRAESD
jgi:hypothetical protein